MRASIGIALCAGLLLLSPAAPAQEAGLPVELTAREMTYEQESGVVTARGDVEIVQGERILFADTVSYDEAADIVTATGNVVLQEPTGDVLFAEQVELTDNFKRGVVQELKVRLSNRARLSARSARREGADRTVLERAVFTRCEACPDSARSDRAPIWQIKASSVTRDLESEVVEYEDAMVEMFGVPVFYTPYFFHPDPTVERKSGLLAPIFGSSGELGFQYTQPYYAVIDDSSDLTFSPRVTSKEGVVFGGEYRKRFRNGRWDTDGTITYVDEIDATNTKTGNREFRGHLRSEADFRLSPQFNAGFNFFRASDDTYLRRYDIASGSVLRSDAFLTGFNGRHFAGMEFMSFQGLRIDDDQGDIPIVMPLASFRAGGEPDVIGGRTEFELSGVALQRTSGRDVRRLSLDSSWRRQFIDGLGGLTTTGLHLRADGYMVSEALVTDPTASADDYLEGRIWPMAVLDWRLPLVRGEGRVMQTIEPRVQLIGSPAGGNPNDIPNEDSVSFEFTDGNLFSRNRFAGHDRIESGSRLNYGVKAGLIGLGGGSSEIEIGQSFRINDNSAFQPGTGLEDRMSDIVGRVTIMPTAGFAYTFRYRVDVNGPRLNRHEHQLRFDGESYRLDLNYVSVPRIGNGVAVGNTEEISFDGGVDISEYWEMLAGYRGDFSGDGAIRLEGGVRYLDECFDFELGAARDFTSDRDDEASTSFFVRVRLRGLN